MMCQMMGLPPTSTIGLGRAVVSSASLVPLPPAKMITCMASNHFRLGNRDNKFAAAIAVFLLLAHDLFGEIPSENQNVIGLLFEKGGNREHREMHPGGEQAGFQRAPVHCIRDQAGADPAIIQ